MPVGLDFTAVMAVGAALNADGAMLADVLPDVEVALLNGLREEGGGDDGE